MILKKVFAANVAMCKALVSSYLFFTQFSYFIVLYNIKNKKSMVINATASYFMVVWMMEYVKMIEKK